MEKNEFSTKDIFESSFLYCTLKILPRIEKDAIRNYYWFIFPDFDNCQRLIESYWNQKAKVDPKVYADAFRSMKDLLYRSGVRLRDRSRP
jgi:hypothetical protein